MMYDFDLAYLTNLYRPIYSFAPIRPLEADSCLCMYSKCGQLSLIIYVCITMTYESTTNLYYCSKNCLLFWRSSVSWISLGEGYARRQWDQPIDQYNVFSLNVTYMDTKISTWNICRFCKIRIHFFLIPRWSQLHALRNVKAVTLQNDLKAHKPLILIEALVFTKVRYSKGSIPGSSSFQKNDTGFVIPKIINSKRDSGFCVLLRNCEPCFMSWIMKPISSYCYSHVFDYLLM